MAKMTELREIRVAACGVVGLVLETTIEASSREGTVRTKLAVTWFGY